MFIFSNFSFKNIQIHNFGKNLKCGIILFCILSFFFLNDKHNQYKVCPFYKFGNKIQNISIHIFSKNTNIPD